MDSVIHHRRHTFIVWDFDWSLINCNSDTWVLDALDRDRGTATAITRRLREITGGWTRQMDWALGELHAQGVTVEEIIAKLAADTPVLRGAYAAVNAVCAAAKASGVTQVIVSDANSVYIEAVLASSLLPRSAFAAVVTNPANVDADGRLRVRPHHPDAAPPHECGLCPKNLCKGAALEELIDALLSAQDDAEESSSSPVSGGDGADAAPRARESRSRLPQFNTMLRPRIAYIGDGGGDFHACCGVLAAGDLILARRKPHGRLLQLCTSEDNVELMASNGGAARVVAWGGVEDPEGSVLGASVV